MRKTLVAHVGARHGYAVPATFAAAGALENFCTDMCGTNGLGRLAAPLARLAPRGRTGLEALAFRAPPPAVAARTKTFDAFALATRRRMAGTGPAAMRRLWEEAFEAFGRAIVAAGFGAAEAVYGAMHEAGPALAEARRRGLAVAAEVYITPSWDRRLAAEHARFPGWGERPPTFADVMGPGFRPYAHMLDNADLLVCPAPAVQQDLVDNFCVSPARTALVPYAVADRFFAIEARPEQGRILFSGTADLRKGIHHFAHAAQILRRRGDAYTFVVAGAVAPGVRERGEAMGLRFLGRVPLADMADELARADLVVLPSVAEGSAGATYEALAAGVPLVASAAAGSVARDGIDGAVLAEPDGESLAEAIGRIVADRALRARMAAAARERAREFTWQRFGARLCAALAAPCASPGLAAPCASPGLAAPCASPGLAAPCASPGLAAPCASPGDGP